MRLALGLLGVMSVLSSAATVFAQTPQKWTPELMLTMRRVAHVRPSPDATLIAYSVSEAVMTDDRSEWVSQIWVASRDGSSSRQLTFGTKSSSNPQWSHDGEWLAFLSERTGKTNLFRINAKGGEAEQLTDEKTNVSAFGWSPDGRQIAFVVTDAPTEADEKATKSKNDFRWVDRDLKMDRLCVVAVEKDAKGQRTPKVLTPGPMTIAPAARPGGGMFDWSPDSRALAFSHRRSPNADDWPNADVSIVDVTSGAIAPLVTTGAAEFAPLYSPDGKSVALVASDNPPLWAGDYQMQVVTVADRQVKRMPVTRDQQPTLIGWSRDGSRLVFAETWGTTNRLSTMHVGSGQVDDVYAGDDLFRTIELNPSRTAYGFVLETPQQAPEACWSTVDRFQPQSVSRANAHLPPAPVSQVEVVKWKSSDGQMIDGILSYPANYKAGQRVPLLLQIHGGPMGVWVKSYTGAPGNYPNAAFLAEGYAILQPNPRGSTGYGKTFRHANYRDWGGGDFRDLMTGVDHVISMGVADPERLGVMGWSYGGYLTSWTITQTPRFKAASVGAAVTNLVSFTGTADIPGFLPDYFGGQPWDEAAATLYRERSPVFRAKGVTTPTLVQHGEADVRVPVTQGYEYYNALKQQQVPVEMLVLPRQPHGPHEPRMMLKLMQTNLELFEKHLSQDLSKRLTGVKFDHYAEAPGYSEGPTWRDGVVYFCSGALYRVPGPRQSQKYLDLGPAGTILLANKHILICDNKHKAVLDLSPDGQVGVVAERYQDEPLRSLNDLTVDAKGNVYWSDPEGSTPTKPVGHVYRLSVNGKVDRVATGLAFPNGLDVDPASRHLYVIESQTQKILRYELPANDQPLGKPEMFYDLGGSGGDGCAFDAEGNLWVADFHRPDTKTGRITVLSPEAKVLAYLPLPSKLVSNIAFGGKDHDEIFCTTGEPPGVFHAKVGVKGFKGHPGQPSKILRTISAD